MLAPHMFFLAYVRRSPKLERNECNAVDDSAIFKLVIVAKPFQIDLYHRNAGISLSTPTRVYLRRELFQSSGVKLPQLMF